MARLWQVSHIYIVFREKGTAARCWTRGAGVERDWWRGEEPNKKRDMVEMVPDSLQGLEVRGKLSTAILLLLQLPPECTQLLLSLHLDVVGHHHGRLEVRLEPTPLLFFILKTKKRVFILHRSIQANSHSQKSSTDTGTVCETFRFSVNLSDNDRVSDILSCCNPCFAKKQNLLRDLWKLKMIPNFRKLQIVKTPKARKNLEITTRGKKKEKHFLDLKHKSETEQKVLFGLKQAKDLEDLFSGYVLLHFHSIFSKDCAKWISRRWQWNPRIWYLMHLIMHVLKDHGEKSMPAKK